MAVDNDSPPGAWANELRAAPWGYGQYKRPTVEEALWNVRKSGLSHEANVLAAEIAGLRAEIEKTIK